MHKEAKTIRVTPDSELASLIRDAIAAGVIVVVDTGEAAYPLYPASANRYHRLKSPATNRPPTAGEVARSRAGILASAGSWKDFDVDGFKRYIRERRNASSRPPVD